MFSSAQLDDGKGQTVLFNSDHISRFTWGVKDDNAVVAHITDAASGSVTRIQLGSFSGGEEELHRRFARAFGDYCFLG